MDTLSHNEVGASPGVEALLTREVLEHVLRSQEKGSKRTSGHAPSVWAPSAVMDVASSGEKGSGERGKGCLEMRCLRRFDLPGAGIGSTVYAQ